MRDTGESEGALEAERYLLWVQVLEAISRHVFGQGHGLEAEGYGVFYDVLQLVLCVAGAELARV